MPALICRRVETNTEQSGCDELANVPAYALALATERAGTPGHYIDIGDSLDDIRETLDRVTRAAAELYHA